MLRVCWEVVADASGVEVAALEVALYAAVAPSTSGSDAILAVNQSRFDSSLNETLHFTNVW
jgi:hypothetical protein